ncbi:DUF808 domain-containing protein [Rothia sp. P7181]|uniref:DUF808 domain-containing protein n=1 Tax=Rothia sp. P7181 TaxID=3402663 RepID=UPI003AE6EE41
MAGGLVALLDDIAALVKLTAASTDDIAAVASKASARAIGVVVDDTAVVPQYLNGVEPRRELPIIRKIAVGSLRNKLFFILPLIIFLSWLWPASLTPLLMLGGLYLCFEGAEKILELFHPHSAEETETPAIIAGEEAEKNVISGAIRTDFILSAEIMVIAMNTIAHEGTWAIRIISLIVVAVLITLLVYGVVAVLVKMDDVGLALMRRESSMTQKIGAVLVSGMPLVMKGISLLGTFAMLWVGGHIVLNGLADIGLHAPEHAVEYLVHALTSWSSGTLLSVLAWCAETFFAMIFGLLCGGIAVVTTHFFSSLRGTQ